MEVIFVVALISTTAGLALPQLAGSLEEIRSRAAVRYLTARLQKIRTEAVMRSANVGVRFTADGRGFTFGTFADGNGDGIRASDIAAGIDTRITPEERLSDHAAGVDFGVLPGLPAVDSSSAPPGSDPIRTGPSDLLVFTPLGTTTSGSLYIRSASRQYVVRLLGETGRTRILAFDPRQQTWSPLR